jgi:hypothetical protein
LLNQPSSVTFLSTALLQLKESAGYEYAKVSIYKETRRAGEKVLGSASFGGPKVAEYEYDCCH